MIVTFPRPPGEGKGRGGQGENGLTMEAFNEALTYIGPLLFSYPSIPYFPSLTKRGW